MDPVRAGWNGLCAPVWPDVFRVKEKSGQGGNPLCQMWVAPQGQVLVPVLGSKAGGGFFCCRNPKNEESEWSKHGISVFRACEEP